MSEDPIYDIGNSSIAVLQDKVKDLRNKLWSITSPEFLSKILPVPPALGKLI